MKVPTSVRTLYEALKDQYDTLKERVDALFPDRVRLNRWHYFSRVKSLESFALKLETGRLRDPSAPEDMFACTVVVENSQAIPKAIEVISEFCVIDSRKPEADNFTHLTPDRFAFDDLRLYVRLTEEVAKLSGLEKLLFEIQIKTFLQHAWGVATHDLIYKGTTVSWPDSRIAYQIKAMLEHAELAILQAENLAEAPTIARKDKKTLGLLAIIEFLEQRWTKEQLPADRKRIAENIYDLMNALRLQLDELTQIVDEETGKERGVKLLHLSPYSAIVQSIANAKPDKLKRFFGYKESWYQLFLPAEVVLPSTFGGTELKHCILGPDLNKTSGSPNAELVQGSPSVAEGSGQHIEEDGSEAKG